MTNVGLGNGVSGSRCSYQLTWGSPRTGMWVRSAAYLAVPEEFQKLPFNFRSTNFKTTPRLSIKRHCTATTLKQGNIAWFRWDMHWLHNNLNTVLQTRALPKVAAIKKLEPLTMDKLQLIGQNLPRFSTLEVAALTPCVFIPTNPNSQA